MLVVTGANGFVGTHVAELAAAAGHNVIALGRETEPSSRLAAACFRYVPTDLHREWPIREKVDAVIHLAGLAAVGPSFTEPQRYIDINSGIMTRMSEGLLAAANRPRIVIVSSGSVYATSEELKPIAEDAPTAASSPYVVAKLLVESQASYYSRRGMDMIVARPFNHIGPGQGRGFVLPDLVAAMEMASPGDAISVGNIHTHRDFTDVRDVARAYLGLVEAPAPAHFTYNVASGESHSVYDLITEVARLMERPMPPTQVDPDRIRPNDPARIVGDASRLRSEIGWRPVIAWSSSIRDYIESAAAGEAPPGGDRA